MPRVQILKCDKCDVVGEDVHTYRIVNSANGQAYEVLACDEHAAPILELLRTAEVAGKPQPLRHTRDRRTGGISEARLKSLHADR